MKKRLIVLFLAALLLLSMIPGVSGSELVCFVGVNDTIPTSLPGEAAPYYANGTLYIPYTAFDAGPNGVFTSYNTEQNTFVIANRNQRLVYDLTDSIVTDENGSQASVELSYRGGLLFIPGLYAASHFGLNLSILTSVTGCPIIRFTNGSQVYDDTQFVKKAETLISYMLEHYAKKEEDRPHNPDYDEPPEEVPDEEPETRKPGVVYLAFAGDAVCKETLKHLEALDSHAVFFVTETQLNNDPDLIRVIYGGGHTIGITTEDGEPDPEAGLRRANEALDRCIYRKTLMALVPDGVEPEEYIIWNEAEDASSVEEILENYEIPHLLLCRTDVLRQLKILTGVEMKFPLLRETTSLHSTE